MKLVKSLIIGTLITLASCPAFAKNAATTSSLTTAELSTLAAVGTIDSTEVLVSVIAMNKNPSSGVSDLAKMMIDQHGSNLTQLLEMLKAADVKSLSGSKAEELATEGKKNAIMLGGVPAGDQFDKAYVDAMVTGHEAALKLIDTQLMKTAKSDEMKKFMTDTRAAVAEHLEHAQALQAQMKS